jgi:hypothetical protein
MGAAESPNQLFLFGKFFLFSFPWRFTIPRSRDRLLLFNSSQHTAIHQHDQCHGRRATSRLVPRSTLHSWSSRSTKDNGTDKPVLDLPQLYEKPSGTDLVKALALLSLQPRTFGTSADVVKGPAVQPAGVTRYLTSIISSPLAWLETDELREAIWDAAAARLSERSGRAGMRSLAFPAVLSR